MNSAGRKVLMSDDQKKTLVLLTAEGWTTPTKLGLYLGYDYYGSSSKGFKVLAELVHMGLVKKHGEAQNVQYKLVEK